LHTIRKEDGMKKSALSWGSRGVGHLLRLGLALCIGLVSVETPITVQSTKLGETPATRAEVSGPETALNRAGEIVHRHERSQQDVASTLEAIRRAAQD
jgi:hypothetical protein